MCDAVSLAGLAFSGAASYQKAKVEKRVAENNAQLAEWQAHDALVRGGKAESDLRRAGAKFKSTQTARLTAGNVQLQGSALDILEQTDRMVEEDAAVIRENASREAWARRLEAAAYRAGARGINPALAAGTTLLGGAGQVADRWYRYGD